MAKWYKIAGAVLIVSCTIVQANAQTHYGQGAGTQGASHSFFGLEAGKVNTGPYNTFIGHFAGASNTTGESNTFVGNNAGYFTNSSGSENTFVGAVTGYFSNGNNNTFIGFAAGESNKSGNKNTFVGDRAASVLDQGNDNVAVGHGSGKWSCCGSGNAFLGNQSGYNNHGSHNSFFGYKAGIFNSTGSNNTYLGYASGGSAALTNATAIGANAIVTSSNCIALGNSANVGIGVSAPAFQLHLSTDAAAKAGSPDWTVASDSRLKKNITDFTDGLDLLKQIRPVWFQYNGQAGIETGEKKFVGIIAQEMQKIAPYTIGTFTHQDSLGNKTEYLDYDANAVTYILINSVKEQQSLLDEKEAKIELLERQASLSDERLSELTARLEKLERLSAGRDIFHKTGEGVGGAVLEQNAPNGFSGRTSIKYFIPQSVKTAVIDIYSVDGTKVSSYPILQRGDGELEISADRFKSGVHLYDLIMDGKSFGTKKMLIE